ncbi:MAG: DUF5916 domain-containing protein, partial [Vicinamibacterales bacterium]
MPRLPGYPSVFIGTLIVLASFSPLAAQDAPERVRRTAAVTAITSRISLDGVLDEAAWTAAPTIGDLVQRQPRNGQPPTERTEVRLLHDQDYLYIGVTCFDSQPRQVVGTQMARDASLNSDDRIEIVLDTFRDQSNAFYFATNPAGALVDGLAFTNGQLNNEWDAIWDVRTRRTGEGWTAEFAIPFKSLNFPAGQTAWGFNIARHVNRKQEEARWSGYALDVQFVQVSEAGELTNLENLSQGIGLEVRPFFAGRWLHLAGGDETVGRKPGLDMFYNVTPSLKLTATFNTDFGETEVDARQINLGRFSLLFPERRTFFLADAGVFTFGSHGQNPPPGLPATGAEVFPFFSRQVGLLNGEEVPIDVGVKLTGKAGRTDIGVLDVRTREIGAVTDKNFFVGRVRQNFLQQSYVGAIFTEGHPGLGIASRTIGADVRLASSRFLGGSQNLVVNAYALKSQNEGVVDRDASYGFAVQYPNDRYGGQFILREIQQNFRPALGFVQRRNVRMMRAGVSFNPRPRDFLGILQTFHDAYLTQFTRLDNGLVESRDFYLTLVDWHFRNGDAVHGFFDFNPTYERLFAPFEISPGVILPVGEYRFTRWKHVMNTASRRRLQLNLNVSHGEYWSGRGETYQTTFTLKLPPRFNLQLSTNQTHARLPQGNFIARIFSSTINYSHTPFVAFSNLIQFDNLSRNLGWQSRLRWTTRPGNDLFLVFNQGWIQDADEPSRFTATDSRVSAKF